VPTYQYACTGCEHRFEAVQSFSDSSLTECPACAGLLRKVFSSVGIVFKGSGFYRTDSRSGSAVGAKKDGDGSSKPGSNGASDGSSSSGSSSSGSSGGSGGSSTGASSPKPVATAS